MMETKWGYQSEIHFYLLININKVKDLVTLASPAILFRLCWHIPGGEGSMHHVLTGSRGIGAVAEPESDTESRKQDSPTLYRLRIKAKAS